MNNYDNNSLPENIKKLLDSDWNWQANKLIRERNFIYGADIVKNTKIVADLIDKKIVIADLKKNIEEQMGYTPEEALPIARDIIGIRLLAFDDYFNGEAAKALVELGGKKEDYQEFIDKTNAAIAEVIAKEEAEEKEEADRRAKLEALKEQDKEKIVYNESNDGEELASAPELFRSSIAFLLGGGQEDYFPSMVFQYNAVLFNLLDKYPNFKNSLEKALLANEEKITNKNFDLDGHPAEPTIGNWLKDFIKVKGSDYFEGVVLADYITNSKNAKNLNDQERAVLANLLKLYRNIKFFPENLKNIEPERWELIPLNVDDEGGYAENRDSYESNNNPQVQELENLAASYKAGSLERKAIEEEIKKIKR